MLQERLDPSRYVLKGGANLRYFFDSMRYSEDIDLDISGVKPWALTEKIDSVLGSRAMEITLRANGLAVAGFSKPKQTETTQRWKLSIDAGGSDQVRSKIEFSNRNGDERHLLESVPARIVEAYALRPPTVQHYTVAAATEQKIRALAGRSETQARDVFDLELLLRRAPFAAGSLDPSILSEATDRALELPFGAFRDQVLPFLEAEIAESYDSAATWEQIQTFVAERLEPDENG